MTRLVYDEIKTRFSALGEEEQKLAAECLSTDILITELYGRLKEGERLKESVYSIIGGLNNGEQ